MDGSTDQAFAALKELAACLDAEIPNAANCLQGPSGILETKSASTNAATQVFEKATLIEAELKMVVLRLEKVIQEKLTSINEMTECLKQVDSDNRETLEKLIPLGFKVPDNLLPALENLFLQSYRDTATEATNDTLEDSLCSLTQVVTKLEPAFSKAAAESSHARTAGHGHSKLSKSLPQPCSSKRGSRSPPRRFQTSSNLQMYLEEIDKDNTITLMKYKPLRPERAAKASAALGSPVRCSAAPASEKPEASPRFSSLNGSPIQNTTFISGIEPLAKTPELAEKPAVQVKASCLLTPKAPDFEERPMKTPYPPIHVTPSHYCFMQFKERCPSTPKAPDSEECAMKVKVHEPRAPKTPELMDYPTPVKKIPELMERPTPELKENIGFPW
nr:histone-lysine N-methyltransferase SETD1B-like isoform X9 [Rhipicephalus microplus]XP_037281419.1 histone-lysine N-methyltransferase SETD1B-like isoform X10 [Rhipicephalus microplus]